MLVLTGADLWWWIGRLATSLLEKQNVSILKEKVNIMAEIKANSLQFGSNSRIAKFWARAPLIL